MTREIEIVIYREDDQWVAQALNVDVSSFGATPEEARTAITDALELYFEDEPNADGGTTTTGDAVILSCYADILRAGCRSTRMAGALQWSSSGAKDDDMPTSWHDVIALTLSPVLVAVVFVIARRKYIIAILILSICALGFQAINLLIYFPEQTIFWHFVPTTPIDIARSIIVAFDLYALLAAWMLAAFDAAQRQRFVWLMAITACAAISLIAFAVVAQPYAFFSPQAYTLGVSLLLIPPAHISGLMTLIYSLVTWVRDRRTMYIPMAPMFGPPPVFVQPPAVPPAP